MSETERIELLRIIDVNLNRASEGLRVVEEHARFVLDDPHLARLAKELRHDLRQALARIDQQALCAARETRHDVGVSITTVSESRRSTAREIALANQKRVEQSLRCLEEYLKPIDGEAAAQVEQLRYRTYTLARAIEITSSSQQRLAHARLYALVDGCESSSAFQRIVERMIAGGVHVIQLRDKQLQDRELLARARTLRQLTAGSRTLFVMNDRPDLALLARADGVHIGQEELRVKDVRQLVGTEIMIGVSTHDIGQARSAVLDGADYLGCGPTFPSSTKAFTEFSGLEFLRQVTAEIRLPAFAIGGIDASNADQVLATGFRRIAVASALTDAPNQEDAARELLALVAAAPGNGAVAD